MFELPIFASESHHPFKNMRAKKNIGYVSNVLSQILYPSHSDTHGLVMLSVGNNEL